MSRRPGSGGPAKRPTSGIAGGLPRVPQDAGPERLFDRMPVAQAQHLGLGIATAGEAIARHDVHALLASRPPPGRPPPTIAR